MPWMRSGDDAATYPKLMATAGMPGADERTVNEVAGWLWRCATLSGAHTTDYFVNAGTSAMIGGSRTPVLERIARRARLIEPAVVAGVKGWKLIEDPEFIHLRLKAEIEWERQQRNDTRDPALKVPALLRDGDTCRWCGVLVQWRGRTTNRTGTLDHLMPGQPGTPTTMVVACKRCNSARKDNPQWDDDHPLRPAPTSPLYGAVTAAYLTEHGYPTEQNLTSDQQRPAPAPGADTAPPTGVRSATAAHGDVAQGAAGAPEESAGNSIGQADRSTPAGSGKDGSATGWGGGGSGPPPNPAGRRRGRRGGRRRVGEG